MTCSRCFAPGADASTLCASCLTADAKASREAQGLEPTVDEVTASRIASSMATYAKAASWVAS